MVHHLLGAGNLREAGEHAVLAARQAEETLTFSLAADMYDVAARHLGRDRRELLRARARNLDGAGRYAECAACWEEIAAECTEAGPARGDALVHEVSARFSANQPELAQAKMPQALQAAGIPLMRGRVGAWLDLVRLSIGPGRIRKPLAFGPNRVGFSDRAQRDLVLVFGAFMADRLTGIRLMVNVRHALERAGDIAGAAGCDWVIASCALNIEPRGGVAPLAERYRAAAEQRLGGPLDGSFDDHLMMASWLGYQGTRAVRLGDWTAGSTLGHRLVNLLEANGMQGTMLHRLGLVASLGNAVFSQNLELVRVEEERLELDLKRTKNYWLNPTPLWLTLKLYRSDSSTDDLRRWLASAPQGLGPQQRIDYRWSEAVARWIAGDAREAARELRAAFRAVLRARHNMFTCVHASIMALVEAVALRAGDRDASPRWIRKCARLAELGPPYATTRAIRALAYLADAQGRPERAISELSRAEKEAERHGQRIDVAIARYQRGLRLSGDEGAALAAESRAVIEQLGLKTQCLEEDRGR
jgi:hypothetical protein